MYATLHDFLRLSPADQAKVTHLDLSIAGPEDLYRASPDTPQGRGLEQPRPNQQDWEEWPGETSRTYPEWRR